MRLAATAIYALVSLGVFAGLWWLLVRAWSYIRARRGGGRPLAGRNPGPPGGYHFIGWSLQRMPDWFNRLGMRVGTSLCFWTLPKQRAASREYLRLVLGREPLWSELWEHFFAFTKYLLLRLTISQGAEPEVCFAPGQGGELRAWIAQGRPALYGTMHVGRSDLVGFFLGNLGERVHMIRKQVGNSEDTRRLARRYERSVTFIWINDWSRMILAMNDALRAGHSLAMQCDRPEYSSKHDEFQFLGARRVFPFTIYHLAIMHAMPVVLSYAVPDTVNPEKTVVHMPPMYYPRETLSRQENFAAARDHFQAFLSEVEALLKREPYLWFNFTPMNPPRVPSAEAAADAPARRSEIRKLRPAVAGADETEPAEKLPSTSLRQGSRVLT